MDNSTYNERMMLYLDGELQGTEKDAFEKQLAADPSLKDELEQLRIAKESVRLLGLKQHVAAIHGSMMNEFSGSRKPSPGAAPVRRMIRYGLAVAASILIIFIGVKSYQFYTLSPDSLFKEQYSSFELSSVRGAGPATSAVEKAYHDKNYTELISISHKSDSLGVKDIFLTGMAYMETYDFANAIEVFKKVSAAKSNSIFKDAAEYYLYLAYIKNKNYDQALRLMHAIGDNPAHLYHDKISNDLIRKVKMLKWK